MSIVVFPVPVEVTPEITALGVFAVEEHNKKAGTHLEFKKVLSAMKEVRDVGNNYFLTLEAGAGAGYEGNKTNLYDATVFVSERGGYFVKALMKFKMLVTKPGEPVPIEVTPKIDELGRWAVDEYNKKESTNLKFKSVWSAKEQEVEGSNYYLTLEAADGGKNNVYDAKVFVSLKKELVLEGFKPAWPPAPA